MAKQTLIESGRVVSADKRKQQIVVDIIQAGMGNSRDRRMYPADVLERDHSVFVGRKMFANHLTEEDAKKYNGRPRDIRDLTGRVLETWWQPNGGKDGNGSVRGVVSVSAPWLWQLVEHDPELIELSINAVGKTRQDRGSDGRPVHLVESVTRCDSVDWVAAGGAGGRIVEFLESQADGEDNKELTVPDISSLTMDALREANPDLVREIEEQYAIALLEGDDDESEDDVPVDADADDDDDIDGDDDDLDDGDDEPVGEELAEGFYTRDQVLALMIEAGQKIEHAVREEFRKRDAVREMVEAADLPARSASSLIESFTDFDGGEVELRDALRGAIEAKRLELADVVKAARGPRVTGNGLTDRLLESAGAAKPAAKSAHQSVMNSLGI